MPHALSLRDLELRRVRRTSSSHATLHTMTPLEPDAPSTPKSLRYLHPKSLGATDPKDPDTSAPKSQSLKTPKSLRHLNPETSVPGTPKDSDTSAPKPRHPKLIRASGTSTPKSVDTEHSEELRHLKLHEPPAPQTSINRTPQASNPPGPRAPKSLHPVWTRNLRHHASEEQSTIGSESLSVFEFQRTRGTKT